jgi:transcriptional regulator GlxA family with amidase domain
MDLRIEKVVALMKDDLTQRLPLGKMAQIVNLSPAHLCYLFKAENGIPAARYLKSLRMKKAAVLLATTFLSVKEVMVRVGLRDESHFVKDFKKSYGLTPTEYRRTKAITMADCGKYSRAPKHRTSFQVAETVLIPGHGLMLRTGTTDSTANCADDQ